MLGKSTKSLDMPTIPMCPTRQTKKDAIFPSFDIIVKRTDSESFLVISGEPTQNLKTSLTHCDF
jgi:hypothetical protein